jgi:hypothetical protein
LPKGGGKPVAGAAPYFGEELHLGARGMCLRTL